DIHDGPEHNSLQSKAGYIDARPHIRQLEEIFLQRTAGPYIWVISRCGALLGLCPLYPRKRTKSKRSAMSALCQKRTNAPQQMASLFDPPSGGVGGSCEGFAERNVMECRVGRCRITPA